MDKQEILKKLDEIKAMLTEEQGQEETKSEFINDLYSWSELQNLAQSGQAAEKIAIGDKLKVTRYNKDIIFDVVKVTDSEIYLMSHYLIAQMPFDAPEPRNPNVNIAFYGSNDYLNSSVRQWLNSEECSGDWWKPKTEYDTPIACEDYLDGFMYNMDINFLDTLQANENGDEFFLPSEDEIKEWFPNVKDRIKSYVSGKKDWYWLRTPLLVASSSSVHYVNLAGNLAYGDAYCAGGIAPACVIG